MYINDHNIERFSKYMLNQELQDVKEIIINKKKYSLIHGHNSSINNQQSNLAETNYFGRKLEYIIKGNNLEMPISIQLYENSRDHYRIYAYNKKGMLTSVNLSRGYSEGKGEIKFKVQLKLATQNMTKEERATQRDMLVFELENEGIKILGKNTVYFGSYDIKQERFIDTTSQKFLEELIKVAIVKGHYMRNKGYQIEGL